MLRMLAGRGMRVRAEGSRVYVFSGGRMTAVAVSIMGSASSGRVEQDGVGWIVYGYGVDRASARVGVGLP